MPDATTVSVAEPPGLTVVSCGWLVITGATTACAGANATPRRAVLVAAVCSVVAVAAMVAL